MAGKYNKSNKKCRKRTWVNKLGKATDWQVGNEGNRGLLLLVQNIWYSVLYYHSTWGFDLVMIVKCKNPQTGL